MVDNRSGGDILADISTSLLLETKLAKEAREWSFSVRKSPRLFMRRYIEDCSVD